MIINIRVTAKPKQGSSFPGIHVLQQATSSSGESKLCVHANTWEDILGTVSSD